MNATFSTQPAPGTAALDWASVADAVFEEVGAPGVVLDRSAIIRAISPAMEELLGRRRHELIGQGFLETCVPEELQEMARLEFEGCLRGVRHRCAVTLLRHGDRTQVDLETRLVGSGPAAALVAMVRRASTPSLRPPSTYNRWELFDIELGGDRFGEILRSHGDPAGLCGMNLVGRRCYELFGGHAEACPGCPAGELDEGQVGSQRSAVMARAKDGQTHYRILTAHRMDHHRARISVIHLDEATRANLVEARIAALSEQAGLSERERQVFGYLVLGVTSEEIGHLLGITPRTVRFHQHNLLDKLGAESRADLVRLML